MKLAEALLLIQKVPAGSAAYPVLLACGFSPLHLLTFLRAHLQILAADSRVEIQTGLYGNLADTVEQMTGSSCSSVALFWNGRIWTQGWDIAVWAAGEAAVLRALSARWKPR